MGIRLLHILEPATRIFPSIDKPLRFINNRQKLMYTAITLFIYLVCCQIPIYGVLRSEGSDPFYWMRVILASNRGTLMELGLSPIISAGWILQLLIGTGIISADLHTQQDTKLYEGCQKLLAVILAFGQAFAYTWSGAYGSLDQIGAGNAMLIILQLTVSGFIVILLDEMLQKGYGMGSGVSLFIAVNICENIIWRTLSPITIKSEYGTEFQGSLIALIHLLITKPSKGSALYQAFYRASSPNLSNLLATILVFFLVIYLQGYRVELKLVHKKYRGYESRYPIKLFYTSNISVIFQSALVSNMYFISQIIYKRFKGSWWVGLFGTWQDVEGGSIPISGIAYWISPPRDFLTFLYEPLHSLVYILFMMITCAFFSSDKRIAKRHCKETQGRRDEYRRTPGHFDRCSTEQVHSYSGCFGWYDNWADFNIFRFGGCHRFRNGYFTGSFNHLRLLREAGEGEEKRQPKGRSLLTSILNFTSLDKLYQLFQSLLISHTFHSIPQTPIQNLQIKFHPSSRLACSSLNFTYINLIPMLADFVLKGIDNLFNQKLSLQPQKKTFTKDLIKQNLQNVVRKGNPQKSFTRPDNPSPNNKSRLRAILQHNKEDKIRSVIKRNRQERSASPISYTKISNVPSMKSLKNPNHNNSESSVTLKKEQSLISFYREQRKTIEKSRVSENSVNSTTSKNKSRIFQLQEEINLKDVSRDVIRIPSFTRLERRN